MLFVMGLLPQSAYALGLTCTVSATGVAFGVYDPTNASPATSTSNIHTQCSVLLVSVGAQVKISMNKGSSGSYANRTMTNGLNTLSYNLYQDPAHSIVWGDGTGSTTTITDSGLIAILGTSHNHTVYGQVPASQYVPSGSYNDTIIVTIEYSETL
tara:strand:+ start:243348 stop:243812 length:465 start_codon:yes stop_codon:yes gene_type:complete